MSQTNTINTNDCWLYAGYVTKDDYGLVAFKVGNKWHSVYAHRAIHEIHNGEIPEGLQVDHLCFTPRCINPSHLESVTELENIRRSWANRRSATHCPHNHLYAGDNLYLDGTSGARRCRTCKREQNRRANVKRKLKRDLSKS